MMIMGDGGCAVVIGGRQWRGRVVPAGYCSRAAQRRRPRTRTTRGRGPMRTRRETTLTPRRPACAREPQWRRTVVPGGVERRLHERMTSTVHGAQGYRGSLACNVR
jgi:hypothetical protein